MNANIPGTDLFWTVLSAVVFVLALCFACSWLIDNALLPALRGLLHPARPWLERRSPAKGRHVGHNVPRPDESAGRNAEAPGLGLATMPGATGPGYPDYDAEHFGAPDEPFWKDGADPPGPAAPPGTHPAAGPGELDALDLMIEARRQETTVDVFLLPHIAAELGFDSVRSWLESWDRKRQTAVTCG